MSSEYTPVVWEDGTTVINAARLTAMQKQYLHAAGIKVVDDKPASSPPTGENCCIYAGTFYYWTGSAWVTQMSTANGVTVSPIGIGTTGVTVTNNSAMFGPDTPGTTTSGIQEAIDFLKFVNTGILQGNLSIGTEQASGLVQLLQGMFVVTDQIELYSGTRLVGQGRLSTCIRMNTSVGSWISDMTCIVHIGANQNEASVEHLSIEGDRTVPFQSHNIDGIRIEGYNWRPIITDVEIVNCQGNGITVMSSDTEDSTQICYEPLFTRISIQSCNAYGMLLTYCADDTIQEANIQHCSGTGAAYYGGNGNWYKVHVFANEYGMRLAGQPMQLVSPILDANRKDGLTVIAIDQNQSAGGITIVSPMAQSNGSADTSAYAGIRLTDAQHVTIIGYDSINRVDEAYQAYALVEEGDSDYNRIDGGVLVNLLKAGDEAIVIVGSHSSVSRVVGYASNKIALVEIPGLPGEQITSGTVPIAQIPDGAKERFVVVATDSARYALTKSTVHNGCSVYVTATAVMWAVYDDTKLDSDDGYIKFVPSLAWTLLSGVPSSFTPSAHTATDGDTIGKATASVFGHAKVTSTLPSAPGTPAIGTDNGEFARPDHVHPKELPSYVSDDANKTLKINDAGTALEFVKGIIPAALTSVSGTSSGTVQWGMPAQAANLKIFIAYLNNFAMTSEGGTITVTFPIPFTYAWAEVAGAGATFTISKTGIVFAADQTSHSGIILVVGL